jgi:hypothetical protein
VGLLAIRYARKYIWAWYMVVSSPGRGRDCEGGCEGERESEGSNLLELIPCRARRLSATYHTCLMHHASCVEDASINTIPTQGTNEKKAVGRLMPVPERHPGLVLRLIPYVTVQ